MGKLDEFLNEQEMIRLYEEDENRPFEITYLQGMKSKRGRKTFKNRKEYEKWMEKYGDDVSHEQWRYLDEDTISEAPLASKGWTDSSVEKFGKTIGKDAKEKGFFDVCVSRMSGKEGFDAEKAKGFCAAMKDKAHGSTYWRGKGKSKKEVETSTKEHPYKNESVNEASDWTPGLWVAQQRRDATEWGVLVSQTANGSWMAITVSDDRMVPAKKSIKNAYPAFIAVPSESVPSKIADKIQKHIKKIS
jgi:hypothetical protein